MSTTDSWTSRTRARRDEEPARQNLTLGEWLDAMSAQDGTDLRRSDRRRREADEDAPWSDLRGNDRILRTALAELDARERRLERRTDDMMDALGRIIDRTEGQPPLPGDKADLRPDKLDPALDQIDRRLEDIAGRIGERLAARDDRAAKGPLPDLDARLADIARRLDAAQAARRPEGQDNDRFARLESTLEMLVKRLDRRGEETPAALNGPRRRARPAVETAAAQIRAHQIALEDGPPRQAPNEELGERLAAIAERLETAQSRAIAPVVESMRSDIAALAAKLEGARPAIDLSPLNQQLDMVRRSVVAAMSEKPAAPDLAPLQQQIAQLAARFDAARPSVDLSPLNNQIEVMRRAVVAAMNDKTAAPDLAPLHDQIEVLSARLAAPPAAPDLAPLQNQIAALSARLAAPSAAPDLSPLHEQIAALSARLETPQAASDLRPLQEQIEALATKLDRPAMAPDLAALREQMESLGHAVTASLREQDKYHPTQLLDGLELRVDAAGGRIANDVRSQIQVAIIELRNALESQTPGRGAEPLAHAVKELTQRFEAQARRGDADAVESLRRQIDALKGLEHQIKSLTERFDQLEIEPAAAIDDGRIERLADEMRAMAREIDPSSAVAKLESRLLALDAKIDDVKNRPMVVQASETAEAAPPDLSGVETLIQTLADRMEAARSEQTSVAQFAELQSQVRAVAEKLDRTDHSHSLSIIERAVADLFAQIDSLRDDREQVAETIARQAAETAARDAADDALRRATLDMANATRQNPRIDALAEDMSDMRRTSDLVDRKTHETLEAIHTALEKIVERLGAVERDIGAGAKAALQAATLRVADPHAPGADLFFTTPAPAHEPAPAPPIAPATHAAVEPPAVQVPVPTAPAPDAGSPPASEPALAARLPGRRRQGPAPQIEPAPAKSRFAFRLPFLGRDRKVPAKAKGSDSVLPPAEVSRPLQDDVPLELGSGRPSAKAPDSAAALKAQLVAAARRASQLATEEVAKGRRDAKASAGTDEASAPGAAVDASFFIARKKPILMTLAALLLAVIAYGVLAPRDEQASQPTPIQDRVSSKPAPEAPPETIASAPAPQVEATAPETRAEAPQVDPAPVGSIGRPEQVMTMPALSASAAPEIPAAIVAPTLRAAALRGDPAAAHEIGVRLIDGRGVARDSKLALKWFERAAAEGLAPAQFRVGNMYEKGVGAARDLKAARTWYERAAAKGNAKALHNLGVLIAEGGDGKPDYASAAENFLKAAKLGVRDSQYNFAILLARGLGVGQSMPDAYVWLAIAAAQGDEDAGKKRDEIASRLTPEELASARAAAQAFKPTTNDRFANEVATPERGWDAAPPAPPARTKSGKADGVKL